MHGRLPDGWWRPGFLWKSRRLGIAGTSMLPLLLLLLLLLVTVIMMRTYVQRELI